MSGTGTGHCGPLVSVLISTYNRPMYIGEALQSIFAQSYGNFELILVRDGGLPVKDVAERFDDPRLVFIDRDRNRGLPYSFNEALASARGEYVCYLGDDDCFYSRHIELLVGALEKQNEYGAAYSDLYKAHCRVTRDGRRIVLAKNLEISRDFDRMLMLQFNHALHVSVMHKRELIERAGGYNESLNVLIDWDLTRKLCFYTDFLHVPVVTGQYYAPVGDCDRISVQRRKNVNEYLRNLLTIRTTRPPKPWDKIADLGVLIAAQRLDESLERTLLDLWSHSFYPKKIFVPLTEAEFGAFKTAVPNVVTVKAERGESIEIRIERMLRQCDAEFVAVVPCGINVEADEVCFLEKSLYPLLSGDNRQVFELDESQGQRWGATMRTELLAESRRRFGDMGIREGLEAVGAGIRKPKFEEYPFLFDHFLSAAELTERDGDWGRAARIYEYIEQRCGNELWMQIRRANALYHLGRWQVGAKTAEGINSVRPTAASLLVEARCRKKMNDFEGAIRLYEQAEAILDGRCEGRFDTEKIISADKENAATRQSAEQREAMVWT